MKIKDVYPLTIVADRYSGTYSGGAYLAFNCETEYVPRKIADNDSSTSEFWNNSTLTIGKGNTPNEALEDLANKLKKTK